MRARTVTCTDIERWDDILSKFSGASILQTRRFLDYHGDFFIERSLVIEDTNGKICGLFPIASRRETPNVAVSHPGATFGGLYLSGNGSLTRTKNAFDAAFEVLRQKGIETLQYMPPPEFLGRQPNQIDIHLMVQYGANVNAARLISVADLANPLRSTKGRKAGIARGARLGLKIMEGRTTSDYEWFHELLVERLLSLHGARPIHDLKQMTNLRDRLGQDAFLMLVTNQEDQLVAGCWIFQLNSSVWHTQYITSNEAGRASNAVEFMIDQMIGRARDVGVLHISLGTSANANDHGTDKKLFAYKSHFGFGSTVLWRFLLALDGVKR